MFVESANNVVSCKTKGVRVDDFVGNDAVNNYSIHELMDILEPGFSGRTLEYQMERIPVIRTKVRKLHPDKNGNDPTLSKHFGFFNEACRKVVAFIETQKFLKHGENFPQRQQSTTYNPNDVSRGGATQFTQEEARLLLKNFDKLRHFSPYENSKDNTNSCGEQKKREKYSWWSNVTTPEGGSVSTDGPKREERGEILIRTITSGKTVEDKMNIFRQQQRTSGNSGSTGGMLSDASIHSGGVLLVEPKSKSTTQKGLCDDVQPVASFSSAVSLYGQNFLTGDDEDDSVVVYKDSNLFDKLKYDDVRKVYRDQLVSPFSNEEAARIARKHIKSVKLLERQRQQPITLLDKAHHEKLMAERQNYERQQYLMKQQTQKVKEDESLYRQQQLLRHVAEEKMAGRK